MELKIKIDYNEILALIKQLPADQLAKLMADIEAKSTKDQPDKSTYTLQKRLLEGPIMKEAQYKQFLVNREYMDRWRMM